VGVVMFNDQMTVFGFDVFPDRMVVSAIGRGTVGQMAEEVVIGLPVSVERVQELLSVFPISDKPMEFGGDRVRFAVMGIPRSMHSKRVVLGYRRVDEALCLYPMFRFGGGGWTGKDSTAVVVGSLEEFGRVFVEVFAVASQGRRSFEWLSAGSIKWRARESEGSGPCSGSGVVDGPVLGSTCGLRLGPGPFLLASEADGLGVVEARSSGERASPKGRAHVQPQPDGRDDGGLVFEPFLMGNAWVVVRCEDPVRVAASLGFDTGGSVLFDVGLERLRAEPGLGALVVGAGEWTVVLLAEPCERERVRVLSQVFGEAQAFCGFEGPDVYEWTRAKKGKVVRSFSTEQPSVGKAKEFETGGAGTVDAPQARSSGERVSPKGRAHVEVDNELVLTVAQEWGTDPEELLLDPSRTYFGVL
jgi:hypothetical protein